MEKFKGEEFIKFTERFPTDEACYAYLADIKWDSGFVCKKCGHEKYSERENYKRCCTLCKHIESTTAGTLFHKVKFGIRKAFYIMFEMAASTKGLSSSQVGRRYGISRKSAWLFMHKVRLGMESSKSYPIDGIVQVDEFVVGGKENNKQGRSYDSKKKKVGCAVELTDEGKVKRVYAIRIEDFSNKSLRKIFESYISKLASIKTDEWKGYHPLKKEYDIEQIPSSNGHNLKQLHTIVHQIKSWLRTNYSWVHQEHLDKYLGEYSFRINRSIFKNTIFHSLAVRMMDRPHVGYKNIIVST